SRPSSRPLLPAWRQPSGVGCCLESYPLILVSKNLNPVWGLGLRWSGSGFVDLLLSSREHRHNAVDFAVDLLSDLLGQHGRQNPPENERADLVNVVYNSVLRGGQICLDDDLHDTGQSPTSAEVERGLDVRECGVHDVSFLWGVSLYPRLILRVRAHVCRAAFGCRLR